MINWFRNTIYFKSFKGLSKEIWLLSLVMLINRSGAMVLPFLSIYLNQKLEFGLQECGIIMTFFGIGSVLGAFVGGILTDKIGFFKVMLYSLLTTGLAFYLVMNFSGFYSLCGGFFLISLVADTFRPANLTAIEAFTKPENRTRSLSLVRLAINLGYAIGPFMGGYVAALVGFKYLFLINGSTILLAGLIYFLLFRHRKQHALSKDTLVTVSFDKDLPWTNFNYILFLIFFLMTIVVFFQLLYTVPLFLNTAYGFSEAEVGTLLALNGLLIAIIEMPLIYKLEQKFSPIFLVMAGGILIGSAFLCLTLPIAYLFAALLFILVITIGEILSFPFSNTYALLFSKDHNRGKYMGLFTMTFSVSHIIAPLSGLKIAELYGFNSLWMTGAFVCIVASILIMTTKMRKAQVR